MREGFFTEKGKFFHVVIFNLQVIITKLTPDNSDLGLIAHRAIFEKRKDFDCPL